MFRFPPPRLKPDDELLLKWLNAVRDLAVENQLAPGPGIVLTPTPSGMAIGLADAADTGLEWVGVVQSGGISARSGTTPGSGSVKLYALVGGVLVDAGQTVTVYSISSTTGGILSGAYIMVAQDAFGNWWVESVDCGN